MIIPDPSPGTRPFWAAANEQRFLLHHCPGCGTWLHPQTAFCPCGAPSLEWREASGRATLVSYAVVRRTPLPASLAVPYTLLLVRLGEGLQYVCSLPGDDQALQVGMPLAVRFDALTAGVTLPRFAPVEPE